jgi:hypothetical protein
MSHGDTTRLMHRSAWKGSSRTVNFRFTEFSEVPDANSLLKISTDKHDAIPRS